MLSIFSNVNLFCKWVGIKFLLSQIAQICQNLNNMQLFSMFGKSRFPLSKSFPCWESFLKWEFVNWPTFMCCGGKILATINGEQGGKNILVEMLRKYFHTIAFLNKQTTSQSALIMSSPPSGI